MFERFNENARTAVQNAQSEAKKLGHHYIGTEHLLLGLLVMEEPPNIEVSYDEARRAVLMLVSQGEDPMASIPPFTPRAKKVLEIALREALVLGHNYIGPKHIMLALLKEPEGVHARVFQLLEIDQSALYEDFKVDNVRKRLKIPETSILTVDWRDDKNFQSSWKEKTEEDSVNTKEDPKTWDDYQKLVDRVNAKSIQERHDAVKDNLTHIVKLLKYMAQNNKEDNTHTVEMLGLGSAILESLNGNERSLKELEAMGDLARVTVNAVEVLRKYDEGH